MPINQRPNGTADLADGEQYQVPGRPYTIQNRGGVYSCNCSSWTRCADADTPTEPALRSFLRTCKHIKALRGAAAERERIARGRSAGSMEAAQRDERGRFAGSTAPPPPPAMIRAARAAARRATARGTATVRPVEAVVDLGAAPPIAAPEVMAAASTAVANAIELPLLRAERWDGEQDITGWLLSEKFKGIRIEWTGRALKTRLGNPINAPAWMTDCLPDFPLDGELVTRERRPDSQEIANGVAHSGAQDPRWSLMVLAFWETHALQAPFSTRATVARELIDAANVEWLTRHGHRGESPFMKVAQIRARDNAHVRELMADIRRRGAEGLVARDPMAPYVGGRSGVALKIKHRQDAEAVIVEHIPGTPGTANAGRLGAFLVERLDGRRFRVGTGIPHAVRDNPPPVGTVITYSWTDESGDGIPQPASYEGVAPDRAWAGRVVTLARTCTVPVRRMPADGSTPATLESCGGAVPPDSTPAMCEAHRRLAGIAAVAGDWRLP